MPRWQDDFAWRANKWLAAIHALRMMQGMTIDQYLTENGITNVAFAHLVGADQSTIQRLRRGQMPSKDLMAAIFDKTDGAVRGDDFYGIGQAL